MRLRLILPCLQPFMPAGRLTHSFQSPSMQLISRHLPHPPAHTGGNEYGSSCPNPSTLATELPLENQPVPAFPIHELEPTHHVGGSVQDGNQPAPHLDFTAPRAVAPYNYDLILHNSSRHSPSVSRGWVSIALRSR